MRNTIKQLQASATAGKKITMVTCYDYTFAKLVDQAEIDVILVGDSLGNVIQGHDTTLPVTIDDIIYHTRAVIRGTTKAHVIADLPFMSYQASVEEGMRNAGRLLKEGFAQSVKLEGGRSVVPLVKSLVEAGIPVCGHLGLTPQSVHAMGGYRVQAKGAEAAKRLLEDAHALQEAGAYMIVLEVIPAKLAGQVTEELDIPTIGIGAGNRTSGQVLVLQDMLGLNLGFNPKFVKHFAELGEATINALNQYATEVNEGTFPSDAESF